MLTDYQNFVLSKAAPHTTISPSQFNLIHGYTGLATEYLELILAASREHVHEELGDFLWYLMLTAHSLDYNIENLPTEVPVVMTPSGTIRQLGEMLENFISIAKKHVIYGNYQGGVIITAFYGLWRTFLYHLQIHELGLDELIVSNKAKLNKRYTASFSQEEAAQRKDKQDAS